MNPKEEHGGSPLEIEAVSTTSQYTRRRFVTRTGKTAIGVVLALSAFGVEQEALAGGSSSSHYYVVAGYPGGIVEDSSVHPKTIIEFDAMPVSKHSSDLNGPNGTATGGILIEASVSPIPETEIWAGDGTSAEDQPGTWIYGDEDSFSLAFTFSVTTWYWPAGSTEDSETQDGPSLTKSITFTCTNNKNGLHPTVSGGGAPGDGYVTDGHFSVILNRTSAADSTSFGASFTVLWDGKDLFGQDVCWPVSGTMTLSGSWSGISYIH